MARVCLFWLAMGVALPVHAQQAPDARPMALLGTPELMRSLAQGGYVIYFRHGHTHWQQKVVEQAMTAEGRHDLANCATQRNLDEIGRNDARRIHAALSAARIPVGEVLASLYCRPAEYVALITGKAPVPARWLTGLSTPETLREIRRAVATAPAAGTNTFLGGHGDRPFDLTGLVIQEGDALVFDPRRPQADHPGKVKPVAWIKPAEWVALSGAAPRPVDMAPALTHIIWPASLHHDAGNLRASLPALAEGATLDAAALSRQLQLVRENPSKAIEVSLRPGGGADADANSVQAHVAVADTRPWSLTAGISHAGAQGANGSGHDRPWLRATHSNLWNLDHQAAIEVSRVGRGDELNTSLGYRVPVPGAALMLGLVATRAHEGAGLDAQDAPITGSGRLLSLDARHLLTPRADYHHDLHVSISDHDWFGAGQGDVRSRPLAMGYAAHWEEEWVGWKFGVEALTNLPGGSGNDAASYAAATAGAATSRRWNALRADAEWLRILTYDIRLRISGRAQGSGQALIAGEQFALGGPLRPWGSAFGLWSREPWLQRDALRGLPERAVAGDSGALASVELWSRRLMGQDLRIGGSLDFGQVRRHRPAPGTQTSANASSLGLNLHWQLHGQVALALGAAHVLRGGGAVRDDSNRLDATLVARY